VGLGYPEIGFFRPIAANLGALRPRDLLALRLLAGAARRRINKIKRRKQIPPIRVNLFSEKSPYRTELRQISQMSISQPSYGISRPGQRLTDPLGTPDNLNTRVGGGEPPTPKNFQNFQKISNVFYFDPKTFRHQNFHGAPKKS